ncbi:MAG: M36 family metallopeptidase, partial [Gammaproteobacteria bacterium]
MIHDIAYYYGFDEAAGNFQSTNYNGGTGGGDEVIGASQFDGANGNNINNATFATPADGTNG